MSWYPAWTFVRPYRGAKGQVALFAPVLLTAFIGGFAALAVDMGGYVRGRQQVENAVDAAALAGAGNADDDAMAGGFQRAIQRHQVAAQTVVVGQQKM